MSPAETDAFCQRAQQLYDEKWKAALEPAHHGEFFAIEPISEEYFFGRTMSEAMSASRKTHPDRLAYCIRIGYSAAVELLGMHQL